MWIYEQYLNREMELSLRRQAAEHIGMDQRNVFWREINVPAKSHTYEEGYSDGLEAGMLLEKISRNEGLDSPPPVP